MASEFQKMLEAGLENNEKVYEFNENFLKELEKILGQGKNSLKLKNLDKYEKEFLEFLNENLIGQEEAKKAVAKTINKLNKITQKNGILGTYFFAGPTGVGKTEMAKLITEFLTGNSDNLIIIQGSELQESHYKSKLFGAPPGYVGFGEDPILAETNLFKNSIKNPHPLLKKTENFAVILVDEAEKMHPNIIQSLLGILNEGKVELQTGKEKNTKIKYYQVTDLSNTIWIFTSNVGSFETSKNSIGLIENSNDKKLSYESAYKEAFSPEFRGRIDYFISFDNLKEEDISKIINLKIKKITQSLHNYSYDRLYIKLSTKLKEFIKQNTDKSLGARNVVKNLSKIVEDTLSKMESQNLLATATLFAYKYNKIIEIYIKLKNKQNKYIEDNIEVEIHIKDREEETNKKEKEITKNYVNKFSSLDRLIELQQNHKNFSILKVLEATQNKLNTTFIEREKLGKNFNKQINEIYSFIEKYFGKDDKEVFTLKAYANLIKQIITKEKKIGDLKQMIDKANSIETLAKILKEVKDTLVSIIKHNLKELKKTTKAISGFSKKETVLAKLLKEIENKFYEKTGKLIGSKHIKNIILYLDSIY